MPQKNSISKTMMLTTIVPIDAYMSDIFFFFFFHHFGCNNQFQFILIGNVQHFHNFAIRHCFVGVQGDIECRVLCGQLLQHRFDAFEIDILWCFAAIGNAVVARGTDAYFDEMRFGGCFGFALRQIDFHIVRSRHGRCYHEKQQQQEYDVGHRRHAERGFCFGAFF